MTAFGAALVGLIGWLLWRRALAPLSKPRPEAALSAESAGAQVSIIVPARNEAHNLPALLRSLRGVPAEVIVVDDHSTDATPDIAAGHGVRLVRPPETPADWLGKPWACWHGARAAKGDVLVFTDADTVHEPRLLARAVAALNDGAALVSIVPTHRVVSAWEKLQGPFQLLLLLAARLDAARHADVSHERAYCIGQYLAFRRDAYSAVAGHVAVRDRVAEDLAFARLIQDSERKYELLVDRGALLVRMYPEGLRAFVAGWRRNFREGLRSSGARGVFHVGCAIGWLLGAPLWLAAGVVQADVLLALTGGAAYAVAVWEIATRQRQVGDFPRWSALAYPSFVLLFVSVTLLAAFDMARRAPIVWRGRRVVLPKRA